MSDGFDQLYPPPSRADYKELRRQRLAIDKRRTAWRRDMWEALWWWTSHDVKDKEVGLELISSVANEVEEMLYGR